MRIAIGSDHAGFQLKQALVDALKEKGHSYEDFGCHDTSPVDYPDIGVAVAKAVAQGQFQCGVLICGTGIGMCIAANKVKGIRAALCHDTFCARMSREHNDANVLCLGARAIGQGVAQDILQAFLSSQFQGGRHATRVEKLNRLDE